MAGQTLRRPLESLSRGIQNPSMIPDFLLPAFAHPRQCNFSTSPKSSSRVGKAPVSIPPEVSLRFFDIPKVNTRSRNVNTPRTAVEVTGPQGQMTLPLPPYIITNHDEARRKVTIAVQDSTITQQRAMWGTMRAHLQNHITGVSENHICVLRLVGVGFRASIEPSALTKQPEFAGQKFISLKLGFAHPVEVGVPHGVKASCPQPTRILLEGCDKDEVTLLAATIRAWRKPEPYKGKGIFVNDETIKLKAKKIK